MIELARREPERTEVVQKCEFIRRYCHCHRCGTGRCRPQVRGTGDPWRRENGLRRPNRRPERVTQAMDKSGVTWTLLPRIPFSWLERPPAYGLGPCAPAQPSLEKKSSKVFGLFDRFLFGTLLAVPARISRNPPARCFTDMPGDQGAAERTASRRANSRNTVV